MSVLRRFAAACVFLAVLGCMEGLPGADARPDPRFSVRVLTGSAAHDLMQRRMALNPRLSHYRESGRAAAGLTGEAGQRKASNEGLAIRHTHISRNTKSTGAWASLREFVSGKPLQARDECVFWPAAARTRQVARAKNVAWRDDPCEEISDVYEYHGAYQSGYDSDNISYEVGVEIVGDVSTSQWMVVDISGTTYPDGEEILIDFENVGYEVVYDSQEEGDPNKTWNGIDCDDQAGFHNFMKQKIGAAFVAFGIVVTAGLRFCAESMEFAAALGGPASLSWFLGCSGAAGGLAIAGAVLSIAAYYGSHWWTCSATPAIQMTHAVPSPFDRPRDFGLDALPH